MLQLNHVKPDQITGVVFIESLANLSQSIGGIGLFLLGMIIMTNGLRALAGKAIHAALIRYTQTPLSGASMGAIGTAILQSSSATTVATVGFVNAGLLSFPNALGIILGANIGTTIKGWLIALLGFKLQLGLVSLPIILAGVLFHLFSRKRLSHAGLGLAGFGLIFLGITVMQDGMSAVQSLISFEQIYPDTLWSRLQLVFLGIVFTLITQSSSAGVAAALTGLFSGMLEFHHAAALVVGMDIGTTATAFIATVGGNVHAKRTGLSHVTYNLMTGTMAFFLITPYIYLFDTAMPGFLQHNPEIALVAFHTLFNGIGLVAAIPVTYRFAAFIQKMVPDESPSLTKSLDPQLLYHPELALNAAQKTVYKELGALLLHVNYILGDKQQGRRANLDTLQQELDDTHRYIDTIHSSGEQEHIWQQLTNMIHTIDHMQRLHERCEEEEDRAITASKSSELLEEQKRIIRTNQYILQAIENQHWHQATEQALSLRQAVYDKARPYRQLIIQKIGQGELSVPDGTNHLEAIRWLRRVSNHLSRITYHLEQSIVQT